MQVKNKQMGTTQSLVITGLFICFGLLIPYVAGHAAGLPGTVLLPMHIPVLMCGLLLGWKYGALCGLATPVLSSLLTGMPPVWPVLPMMMCELIVYGVITGLLRRRFRWPLYPAMLVAMVLGRVANGLAFALIVMPPTGAAVVQSVVGATITGLPGIAIQLALVPAAVKLLEKPLGLSAGKKQPAPATKYSPGLAQAIAEIQSGQYSCVLLQKDEIVHRADGRGVKPLRQLYESPEGKAMLKGAMVADRIIGKAAAMILVLGGAGHVHGEVMSASAKEYLAKQGVAYSFGRCVDMISNRTGNGICPIEKSVLDTDDAEEGYRRLSGAIEELMGQASSR